MGDLTLAFFPIPMCWRSGLVLGGGDVRKETRRPSNSRTKQSGSVWKVILSDTEQPPPLAPHPTPLSAVCPIYPARAAISTQWSNANGAWVQEVGDGCGSERNRQEVFSRDTNKDTKEGSWGKTSDAAGWGWNERLASFFLHYISCDPFRGSSMWKKCEQMFLFFWWGGLWWRLCQRVRVGSAHSAMDSSVENVSLPKKEIP